MIAAARAVLALALLAGFYALVAVMVLLWAAFLVLALWGAGSPAATTPPTNVILVCAAFAPIVVGMVWAVIRTARPAAPRDDTVWVSRRGAPALWATVEELALAVGTRPPDHIRLTAEVNASVTEDASFLGLAPGGRTLHLGLPLLAGLPPAELRAVLAHELGHFSRRHNRFGALAHRGTAGLLAARQAIQDASAANDLVRMYAGGPRLLLGLYTRVFRWLTRPVRRRQEIEADREAAKVAGAGTVADALRSTAALEQAWREFLADFLTPMRRAYGCVPDDPFRVFAQLVQAPELREPLAALRERVAERPADPDDPHPDLATRLGRLKRLPARPPQAHPDGRTAAPLAVPSRYAAELGRALLRRAGTSLPWRDWLGLLAEHRATRALTPLAEAVRTVEKAEGVGRPGTEPGALTVHRVLRLLDSGRRMPLARALNSLLPADERAERDPLGPLADALAVLIGAQLVARSTAYWTMDWTGPGTLVLPDGIAPETIRTWADTAVRLPGQTQRLGLHLAALGVDERAPLPPARGTTDGGAPRDEPKQVSIAPGVTGPARRRITATRALALTVLLGMTGLSYALWANRDEPAYPGTPVTRWTRQPGSAYSYSPAPAPVPTFRLPTPSYHLPTPALSSIDIASLLPAPTDRLRPVK
ncbi:M48 family metallopeptidase [Streptomyces sp. NPDC005393]|uniref:M48 family metallopeptidase n=1 Tax=Streptomyces sp. NPDC005393 TaxID=3157041 RepID=UPI0033B0A953